MASTSHSQRLEVSDSSYTVDASSESEVYGTAEQTLFFDPTRSESMPESSESGGRSGISVEERIERFKCHWSEISTSVKVGSKQVEDEGEAVQSDSDDDDFTEEEVETDNREVFRDLQSHPTWGSFFLTFGYDLGIQGSAGSMEVGEKFAESGQAELFHAHIMWRGKTEWLNERDREHGCEWVLKVFKKGTLLRHLQKQWPLGMLQFRAEEGEQDKAGKPTQLMYTCNVYHGTLLKDGRFAFLLEREKEDLRSFIEHEMNSRTNEDCGPISRDKVELMMYHIAQGVDWLHNRNIVHRDLKASNVLFRSKKEGWDCIVADFECSFGVVGTGFWRAPEILQACRDRFVSIKPELFIKEAYIYSYGMTCYEVLIGNFLLKDNW